MRFKSTAPRAGSRSDGEQRREALLRAAAALFAERGFEETTTREIAAAAGTNVAAIKYYFGDKAGLFAEVMKGAMGRVMEGGDHPTIADSGEPRDDLKAWVVWVLRTGRRHRKTSGLPARLVMQALASKGPLARALMRTMGDPVRQSVLGLIDRLYDGKLEPELREQAFVLIFALCDQFARGGAVMENMGIRVPDDDAGLDLLAERMTNFIIGGLHVMVEHERKHGAKR